MNEVGNVAVLKVFEGDEVGSNDASVLKRGGLLPPEGLASWEGKCKGELRFGNIERHPFG